MKLSPLAVYVWLSVAAVAFAGPHRKNIGRPAEIFAPNPVPPASSTSPTMGGAPINTPTISFPASPVSSDSPTSTTDTPMSTSTTPDSSTTPTSTSTTPTSTSVPTTSSAPPSTHSTSQFVTSIPVVPSFTSSSAPATMSMPTNSTSASTSASATSTPTSSSSSSSGGTSTAVIAGSVAGFVAILAIGFGYAFFSKVRKNRRKDRVFGGGEEDEAPAPPPPPFTTGRGEDSLSTAGWEADYKRSPSPMPSRLSPPAATRQLQQPHDQDYYAQYPGYEHTGGYEQHAGYEQHTGYEGQGYDPYAGQQQYQQPGYGYPQAQQQPYGGGYQGYH